VASGFPEAILLEATHSGVPVYACSASLVAPYVVLTAGHCISGFDGWHIRAPYAGGVLVVSSTAEVYDWVAQSNNQVNPNLHDLGLVYLPSAITLSSYPSIATSPLAAGASVVNLGRIQNGVFSNTDLFVSAQAPVSFGNSVGFPFDYLSAPSIQSGDSGGPDEVPGTTPHLIVAVNSGYNSSEEMLARVDLLATWIQGKIAAHGGVLPPLGDGGSGSNTSGGPGLDSGASNSSGGSVHSKSSVGSSAGSPTESSGATSSSGGGSQGTSGTGPAGLEPSCGNGGGGGGGCNVAPTNDFLGAAGLLLALATAVRRRKAR
jgi:hypothetical protein